MLAAAGGPAFLSTVATPGAPRRVVGGGGGAAAEGAASAGSTGGDAGSGGAGLLRVKRNAARPATTSPPVATTTSRTRRAAGRRSRASGINSAAERWNVESLVASPSGGGTPAGRIRVPPMAGIMASCGWDLDRGAVLGVVAGNVAEAFGRLPWVGIRASALVAGILVPKSAAPTCRKDSI